MEIGGEKLYPQRCRFKVHSRAFLLPRGLLILESIFLRHRSVECSICVATRACKERSQGSRRVEISRGLFQPLFADLVPVGIIFDICTQDQAATVFVTSRKPRHQLTIGTTPGRRPILRNISPIYSSTLVLNRISGIIKHRQQRRKSNHKIGKYLAFSAPQFRVVPLKMD